MTRAVAFLKPGAGIRVVLSRPVSPGHPVSTEKPWVAADQDELVAGATSREVVSRSDGKSGSTFEVVVIEDERYFLKSLSRAEDWIMRVAGDLDYWPFQIWKAGVMGLAPSCIDHATVGMALEGAGDTARLSILMRDRAQWLIPEGDEVVTMDQHRGLLAHMAELHATLWGWSDQLGLAQLPQRFRIFAPDNIAPELDAEGDAPVPIRVADEGWRRLSTSAPEFHKLVTAIHRDPAPLAAAIRTTPQTFLHGDWKMGNLGWDSDAGRTVLLDWAYPGEGPACFDLAWYLALNQARLPETKEASIDVYRSALERNGIETHGWWERQLGLSLLGIMAAFAWEKAVGAEDELAWWEQRAIEGARWLY